MKNEKWLYRKIRQKSHFDEQKINNLEPITALFCAIAKNEK
jgi:hypothetical protein